MRNSHLHDAMVRTRDHTAEAIKLVNDQLAAAPDKATAEALGDAKAALEHAHAAAEGIRDDHAPEVAKAA